MLALSVLACGKTSPSAAPSGSGGAATGDAGGIAVEGGRAAGGSPGGAGGGRLGGTASGGGGAAGTTGQGGAGGTATEGTSASGGNLDAGAAETAGNQGVKDASVLLDVRDAPAAADLPQDGTPMQDATAKVDAASFDPCPALPAPCKIMPSGDSITVGAQSTDTGGYRVPLFRTALAKKQTITFVGPSGAGPATVDGVPFPDAHDGHSGFVIDTLDGHKGVLPLMEQNLTKFAPHIVLLMIGTNDINSQLDLANTPARLAKLIDIVTSNAPCALLVVAKITPTRTDSLNNDVQAFNAALPGLVAERVKAGKHIRIVDMYSAFTANPNYKTALLFDGLHPNDAGYAVMAKLWYEAVATYLR